MDVPDIPRVPVESAALNGSGDRVLIADRATGSVYQPCTLFEMAEQLVVDQPTGTLMERSIDRDNIAPRNEFLKGSVGGSGIGSRLL